MYAVKYSEYSNGNSNNSSMLEEGMTERRKHHNNTRHNYLIQNRIIGIDSNQEKLKMRYRSYQAIAFKRITFKFVTVQIWNRSTILLKNVTFTFTYTPICSILLLSQLLLYKDTNIGILDTLRHKRNPKEILYMLLTN